MMLAPARRVTLENRDVTIEFFSYRNPRVTLGNVRRDVGHVKVQAEAPGAGNHRRWYPVNFHDWSRLRQAIKAVEIVRYYLFPKELWLMLFEPVTFMGVPLVMRVSLTYIPDPPDQLDMASSIQLDMIRFIGN